jgi:CheY-like chemotaxis protein
MMMKRRFTILAIDDDPNDRHFLNKALQQVAPETTIHLMEGGQEAIAYLMGEGKYSDRAEFPYPTFIITDLKMPAIDGFDVLEHIKSNPAWAVIPTIVWSGSLDPDDIRTAYLLGASSYQAKPAGYELILAQMKTVHDYWMNCLVPEVDFSGKQVPTVARGKMGQRFPQPTAEKQSRVKMRPPLP